MRKIAVVSVARSDYGIYRSLLCALRDDPETELQIVVTGMHLAPAFGETVRAIEDDGFEIAEKIESLVASDSPAAIAKSMGLGVLGFAEYFSRSRPDWLVVLGDRFDMYVAALAALPFKIPVAHLHGGEVTAGAIDEALRHSLTKISHLHFVATEDAARRVRQLGEEAWRISVSGAPALDAIETMPLWNQAELQARFSLSLSEAPLLVTFHPVSLQYEEAEAQTKELLAALAEFDLPLIFSAPNADTHGRRVRLEIEKFIAKRPSARLIENFGQQGWFSMLRHAAAMVGNSSSGIIEAASFGLPVVNIGERQSGRFRGSNVLDCAVRQDEIVQAIRRALDPAFRSAAQTAKNPYRADGRSAADIIAKRLKHEPFGEKLLIKRFCDLPELS